jgi:hypothetical protein
MSNLNGLESVLNENKLSERYGRSSFLDISNHTTQIVVAIFIFLIIFFIIVSLATKEIYVNIVALFFAGLAFIPVLVTAYKGKFTRIKTMRENIKTTYNNFTAGQVEKYNILVKSISTFTKNQIEKFNDSINSRIKSLKERMENIKSRINIATGSDSEIIELEFTLQELRGESVDLLIEAKALRDVDDNDKSEKTVEIIEQLEASINPLSEVLNDNKNISNIKTLPGPPPLNYKGNYKNEPKYNTQPTTTDHQ